MLTLRLCLYSGAIAFGFAGGSLSATAGPSAPVVSVPPVISVPPIISLPAAVCPTLLGTWQAKRSLLLTPGIGNFETFRSSITFATDGSFVQVIDKATGTLRQKGTYSITGNHLTLSSLSGASSYNISRQGDFLLLSLGRGVSETLSLVQSAPVVKPAK